MTSPAGILASTFIHVPGIGPYRERELWRRGYLTWDEFLDRHPPGAWRELIASRLDMETASRDLPRRESWRLFPAFAERTAYLDIETDGMGNGITCVGLSDGTHAEAYVAGDTPAMGRRLEELPEALDRFDLLVTFNGTVFDVPILQSRFPAVEFARFHHVDLRVPLHRLGLRGGLKAVERAVGIVRPEAIREADGRTAIALWRAHRAGHPRALETLLAYCLEDVVNLKPLMVHAYNRMIEPLPLDVPRLPETSAPTVPWRGDPVLVRALHR